MPELCAMLLAGSNMQQSSMLHAIRMRREFVISVVMA